MVDFLKDEYSVIPFPTAKLIHKKQKFVNFIKDFVF